MSGMKRIKTKYPGVYYIMGRSLKGKPERFYYIRYRRNGKEFEEKVGRQFQDGMTPSKAAMIRVECIEGKRLPQQEIRKRARAKRIQGQFAIAMPKNLMIEEKGSMVTQEKAFPLIINKGRDATFENTTEPMDHSFSQEILKKAMKKPQRSSSGAGGKWNDQEHRDQLYRTLVDHLLLGITVFQDGRIVFANAASTSLCGYSVEEQLDMPPEKVMSLVHPDDRSTAWRRHQDSIKRKSTLTPSSGALTRAVRKDGEIRWTRSYTSPIDYDGRPAALVTYVDVTEQKKAEELLSKHSLQLEETNTKLGEANIALEEANAALKVLLNKLKEEKKDLEDRMLDNARELVLPFLEKLKNSRLDDRQKLLVGVVESNLQEIISPFMKSLNSKYSDLTATEIRISNLIKQGNSTKEIAELMNISPRTIDLHRNNIRKKLGLTNTKVNLAAYLMTL